MQLFDTLKLASCYNIAVQSQKAVSTYVTSRPKQILPFGFVEQNSLTMLIQNTQTRSAKN